MQQDAELIEREAVGYIGTKYDGGFCVQEELVKAVMTDNNVRGCANVEDGNYGFVSGEYADYVVSINSSNIIEKAIPLLNVRTWRENAAGSELQELGEQNLYAVGSTVMSGSVFQFLSKKFFFIVVVVVMVMAIALFTV